MGIKFAGSRERASVSERKEKKRKEKGETQECMHVYECVPETRRMLEGEKMRKTECVLKTTRRGKRGCSSGGEEEGGEWNRA